MIPLLATMIALYIVARLTEVMYSEYRTGSPARLVLLLCGLGVVGTVVCAGLIYQQADVAAAAFSSAASAAGIPALAAP